MRLSPRIAVPPLNKLKLATAVLTVAALAAAVAVVTARAGGDPTVALVRVTLTTASGGGDTTSFVALDYEPGATASAGRHQYGLFKFGRVLAFERELVGNFVANRQFASAQIDLVTPDGVRFARYRLAEVSMATLKHSFRTGSFALEEAGLAFSSIDYDGFGGGVIRDDNTPR